MKIDSLESRVLCTVSFDSSTQILRWTGSGSDDVFLFYMDGDRFVASDNGRTSSYKDVSYLIAKGRDGNDHITISQQVTIPTILSGQNGDDVIYGGGGNDNLLGGPGNNVLEGRKGGDRIDYGRNESSVAFELNTKDRMFSGKAQFTGGSDAIAGVEMINGSNLGDTYAMGGVGPNPSGYGLGSLFGAGQDAKIAALASNEHLPAVRAGSGDDSFQISGVVGARLFGDAGKDQFNCTVDPEAARPYAWVDYIDGGTDRDTQTISGKLGFIPDHNIINAGGIFNRLYPSIENARLINADFGTIFYGNQLSNNIQSVGSPMALNGGRGDDLINVSGDQTKQITLFGGDGNDLIETPDATSSTGVLTAIIHGGKGNDRIFGTNGADSLYGDEGDDVVGGNGGNDWIYDSIGGGILYGDAGNDTLIGYDVAMHGGDGNDILRSLGSTKGSTLTYDGDAGDDIFYVKDHRYSVVNGGTGSDRARVDGSYDTLRSVELIL